MLNRKEVPEIYSGPKLVPEDLYRKDYREERLVGDSHSVPSKLWRLISVGLVLFISAAILFFAFRGLRTGKIVSKEVSSIEAPLEIGQINEVLKYLVDKSKAYDEVLELSSGKQVMGRANSTDVTLATVVVQKANLRPVPSLDSEPVMTIPAGVSLLVEVEGEEWSQVRAPNGAVVWISNSVVALRKRK